jgi:hypothetical protein
MKTGTNFANQRGPQPGGKDSVNLHKAIAMGTSAPASKRETKPVGMKGSSNGACKVVGLTNR